MRGAASRSVLALVVCLAAAGGAQAQTLTDERVWFTVTAQQRTRPDSPWRWSGDVVVRSRDGVSDVDTTTFRPSLHYGFDSHSSVGGGYAFVMSFPERLERVEEHRWFAQYVWTGGAAGGSLGYRARVEARFIEGNSGEVTRLRQQLRFAHAIKPKSRVALAVYDEFLVHLNETTRLARGIEQNRAFGGVSITCSPSTRLEAGYLNQYLPGHRQAVDRMNHILSTTLVASF